MANIIYSIIETFSTIPREFTTAVVATFSGVAATSFCGFAADYVNRNYIADDWVGVYSWPEQKVENVNQAQNQGQSANCKIERSTIDNITSHTRGVEIWKVFIDGQNFSAEIRSEKAKDKAEGSVIGYHHDKNWDVQHDTISAAFKGNRVGRGTYYLQKSYNNNDIEEQKWWKGTHITLDCKSNDSRTLECPYVLGPQEYRSNMEKDDWLNKPCVTKFFSREKTNIAALNEGN